MADVSTEHLKSVMKYDAVSGVFTYTENRGRQRKAGDVAGCISPKSYHHGGGYRIIAIRDGAFRKEYGAHRLAWFYVYGVWPKGQLDHINGKRDDNRIANLREATRSQNGANRAANSNNTSGLKGVSLHKATGKWRSDIYVEGKALFLGYHESLASAGAAYDLAAYMHFGEFARVSSGLHQIGDQHG